MDRTELVLRLFLVALVQGFSASALLTVVAERFFALGTVLGVVGCSAASRASTH